LPDDQYASGIRKIRPADGSPDHRAHLADLSVLQLARESKQAAGHELCRMPDLIPQIKQRRFR
jgi:hypothetical protein